MVTIVSFHYLFPAKLFLHLFYLCIITFSFCNQNRLFLFTFIFPIFFFFINGKYFFIHFHLFLILWKDLLIQRLKIVFFLLFKALQYLRSLAPSSQSIALKATSLSLSWRITSSLIKLNWKLRIHRNNYCYRKRR